ncbi:MAG: NUDIX domain-containing protein [Sphaerochaeta sp.]
MTEYWDLFDTYRQPLARQHKRGVPLVEGTFHVVVSVWTVNEKNEILLTLRSPQKELYPNVWENTSGSVLAKESSRAGAKRELQEETGIVANEDELLFLGTARKASAFVDVYMVKKNQKDLTITLQDGETVDFKWVTLSELDQIVERGELAFPVAYRFSQFRVVIEEQLAR